MEQTVQSVLVVIVVLLIVSNIITLFFSRSRILSAMRAIKKAQRALRVQKERSAYAKLVHIAEREAIADLQFRLDAEKTLSDSLFAENVKLQQRLAIKETCKKAAEKLKEKGDEK